MKWNNAAVILWIFYKNEFVKKRRLFNKKKEKKNKEMAPLL